MPLHIQARDAAVAMLMCCAISANSACAQSKKTIEIGKRKPIAREFKPRVLMKPLRAIIDAPFIRADQVKDQVSGNELVLGVVINGEARAYPINMLTGPSREIINDALGKREIAATW